MRLSFIITCHFDSIDPENEYLLLITFIIAECEIRILVLVPVFSCNFIIFNDIELSSNIRRRKKIYVQHGLPRTIYTQQVVFHNKSNANH